MRNVSTNPLASKNLGKENLAVPYAAIQQWQEAANKSLKDWSIYPW
jgi:hypothetical protein